MKGKLHFFLVLSCLFLFGCAQNTDKSGQSTKIKKPYEMSYEQIHQLLKGYDDDWPDYPSDQSREIPAPPIQKPYPEDAVFVDLMKPEDIKIGNVPLFRIINQRRSRRSYTNESLSIEELSLLLWCTQGISKIVHREDGTVAYHLRTVPSGGARHPFETYLLINRVNGVEQGVYRYLPVEHKLLFLYEEKKLAKKITEACQGQTFVGQAAVVFVWAAIPYRTEWRYAFMAHRDIAIEMGHICQNLYLTSESIGGGACAILGYNQNKLDQFIGVDGEKEFAVYMAAMGKIER